MPPTAADRRPLFVAHHQPTLHRVTCAGAAGLAAALSLLWWRADANRTVLEYCPDGYCFMAARFLAVLTAWDIASLQDLSRFSSSYLHAHTPLGPLLQAGLSLVVRHQLLSYLLMSAAATLFTWVCVRKTIDTAWPLTPEVRVLLFAAFCTHALVTRAFARPITDALGMACTAAALYAVTRYQDTRASRDGILLFVVQFVGLLARVSFIPALGMPALAELLASDRFGRRARRAVVAGIVYGLLPAGLYLGLTAATGTLHTIIETWHVAHLPEFTRFYTLSGFLAGAFAAVQGYGILLLALLSGAAWGQPAFRLHAAWVLLYLAFLGLGGGALWPRYFLPLAPSTFVLVAPALQTLYHTRPWNVRILVAVVVAANIIYPLSFMEPDLKLPARLLVNDVRDLFRWPGGLRGSRLPPDGWAITATHGQAELPLTIDGRPDTRWTTGRPQVPGMALQVDLGVTHRVAGLSLWSTVGEYPRGYSVETSLDGTAWARVANGKGRRALLGFLDELPALVLRFAPQPARYLRITQSESEPAHWWAIHEIAVYVRDP